MDDCYDKKGTQYERTLPYAPQNSVHAERVNRTVKKMISASMAHARVEEELCGESAVAVAYELNRFPKAGQGVTSRKAFTGNCLDVSGFVSWGSAAVALKLPKTLRARDALVNIGRMVWGAPQCAQAFASYSRRGRR